MARTNNFCELDFFTADINNSPCQSKLCANDSDFATNNLRPSKAEVMTMMPVHCLDEALFGEACVGYPMCAAQQFAMVFAQLSLINQATLFCLSNGRGKSFASVSKRKKCFTM